MERERFILESFDTIDLPLSETQARQFSDYHEFLVSENEKINLTAITDFEDVVMKHFIDSCMWKLKDLTAGDKVTLIDVGTGAGFPGMPLKIVYPELHLVLLDALGKRVDFLQRLVTLLGLSDVDCLHGRAEDYASPDREDTLRESCDFAVSRAVAGLNVLAEYCLPFVRVGGYFVAYKSGQVEEELNNADHALSLLGGTLREIRKFSLPGREEERSLVIIEKTSETPLKYPRKAGKVQKKPL